MSGAINGVGQESLCFRSDHSNRCTAIRRIGYPTLRIHQEGDLSVTIMGILAELKQFVPRPLQLRSSKKYFRERFGPAFFMRPAYCTDCNKKPIKVKDADIVRHVLDGLNAEDPICS